MAKPNVSDTETEERNSSSSSDSEDTESESPVEPQRSGKLNEYEKQRMKTIQENRSRMEAMGLHKMATSLMGTSQKKEKDRKGKNKVVDEDEDYEPALSEDLSCDTGEDDEVNDVDFEVSKSQLKKSKKKSQTPKKRVSNTTVPTDTGFVDDDNALMQAIALSLQDSAGSLNLANKVPMQGTDADSANKASNKKASLKNASNKKVGSCNQEDTAGKRKRKQQTRNRVQMTEDDLIMHFFQFDEAGKGSISLRDLRRMAVSHDFTWSDEEMTNMIRCFDSDGDGKLSLDDFRKIVVRCNMIQGSEDAC
ncbi:hypothetical protein K7X08_009844 [Anisodus acutangulus]|uniref:EF-hand domain-containing protein n=1 Tax=Anisodus acutangulus TaxID=402998 RepID=A0A9Q1N0J1_9SOLA|nr:hypothetical protein K7X08_009844 [Anisodus acutangulus]